MTRARVGPFKTKTPPPGEEGGVINNSRRNRDGTKQLHDPDRREVTRLSPPRQERRRRCPTRAIAAIATTAAWPTPSTPIELDAVAEFFTLASKYSAGAALAAEAGDLVALGVRTRQTIASVKEAAAIIATVGQPEAVR